MSTKKTLQAGMCPICGGNDLHYDDKPFFFGDTMRWNYECRDCHAYGLEINKITHQSTTVMNEDTTETYFESGSEIVVKKLPKCPYCGQTSDSTDPRVLCKECREDFGHTFYDEL